MMELPEGLGFVRPHLDALAAAYGLLRREMDPIPAFERALADMLDEPTYERLQSLFDGEHDAVYGQGAGDRARTSLREALEGELKTDQESPG